MVLAGIDLGRTFIIYHKRAGTNPCVEFSYYILPQVLNWLKDPTTSSDSKRKALEDYPILKIYI
jgi:hypothetical protein